MKTIKNNKNNNVRYSLTDTFRLATKVGQNFFVPDGKVSNSTAQLHNISKQIGMTVAVRNEKGGVRAYITSLPKTQKTKQTFTLERPRAIPTGGAGRPTLIAASAKAKANKGKKLVVAKKTAKPAKVGKKAQKVAKARAVLAKPIGKPKVRVSRKEQEETVIVG